MSKVFAKLWAVGVCFPRRPEGWSIWLVARLVYKPGNSRVSSLAALFLQWAVISTFQHVQALGKQLYTVLFNTAVQFLPFVI